MHTVRIIISGRVQGVGFRAWTASSARKLGLSGWVRNRTEGAVEAVFAGEAHIIDQMLNACRKGPLLAKVSGIERFAHEERLEHGVFNQRDTV